MGLVQFTIRRLVMLVPTLFGLLLLVFVIARVMPGDPVRLALGPEATQEQVQNYRHQLGLDKPFVVQFIDYVAGIFRGDFGQSLRTNRNVSQDIASTLPPTLELVVASLLVAVLIGVPIGVLSAVFRDSWLDNGVRLLAVSGVALPRFWLAIILQITLGSALGLFPIIGQNSIPIHHITGFDAIDALLSGNYRGFVDVLWHLVLPAFALGLPDAAQLARLIRSTMIDVLRKQYILVHRAYGMRPYRLVSRFALRNSLTAALTLMGMVLGALIQNAFLIEVVFSWPGISAYGAAAVLAKDFNAVVAVTLVIGVVYLTSNFLVDLLYGVVDPRIRYQ